MTSPIQGAVAYLEKESFSTCWAGSKARQANGSFQKCEWTNKCKLPVSVSLVNSHALKFGMTEFYEYQEA